MINPLVLPNDIRHLGPDDDFSRVSITAVTKVLSDRDGQLNKKLSETITALNNFQQLIGLPLVCVTLPPLQLTRLYNFRIPPGWQAMVVQASVASSVPGAAKLDISHQAGVFGHDGSGNGSAIVVETTGEFLAGTEWLVAGELVFKVLNTGSAVSDIVASALLAMKKA